MWRWPGIFCFLLSMAAETMPLTNLQNLPTAWRLARLFIASVELTQALARACGHANLSDVGPDGQSSWKREISDLSGVAFAGHANHLRR